MRPPIKVLAVKPRKRTTGHDEEELVAVVPGSFKQAANVAADHLAEHPDEEILIKRGEKILDRLDRLEATELVRPSPSEAA